MGALVPPVLAQDAPQRGFRAELSAQTDKVSTCKVAEPDEKQRLSHASEHFNRGRELYEQGSYDQSIDEFATAYCHEPHPSMLKNIAQAYERQADYEHAVAYLKRYVLELPAEDEQERERTSFRIQVLEGLQARIRVASLPRDATVTILKSGVPVAEARANADEPLLVEGGNYVLRVEKDGYVAVEEPITAEIGQPYSYYFRLEPRRGSVRITTVPSDARIFLDDKLVGLGSYAASVPIGAHSLMVERGDRIPVRQTLEVDADETVALNVALAPPPASGRTELLIGTTLLGGVITGAAFASVFESDSVVSGLGSVGGLGVGFLGGYFGVPRDVEVATSQRLLGATLWGSTEGILLTALLTCDAKDDGLGGETEDCGDESVFFGAGALAGVGGLLTSALTKRAFPLSSGDVAVINSGAIWGLASGALLWSTFDEDRDARDPLLLAGLNIGLLAGGLIASQVEISRGRSALIDLGGLGGLLVGVAVNEISKDADTGVDRADHFALGGMITGLIATAFLTRNMGKPAKSGSSRAQWSPSLLPVRDIAGNASVGWGAFLHY